MTVEPLGQKIFKRIVFQKRFVKNVFKKPFFRKTFLKNTRASWTKDFQKDLVAETAWLTGASLGCPIFFLDVQFFLFNFIFWMSEKWFWMETR